MNHQEIKLCLACDNAVRGRTDKKFCDDQCRNSYHNKLNGTSSLYIKKINKILRKNRLILHGLNTGNKAKTSKKSLVNQGFNFQFHTNTCITQTGKQCFFCYEQGYLPLERGYFALVVNHEYIDGC